MSTTVAITQPTFLPWAGYFDLVASADVFVLLDTVQFEKQSWQSRNRIRSRSGQLIWLSVPLNKAPLTTALNEVAIAAQPANWQRKQRRTIDEALSNGRFFSELAPALDAIYGEDHERLALLNETFIRYVARELRLDTQIVRASELSLSASRVDLLLQVCAATGADHYYSNAGSAVYLEQERARFEANGVELEYQSWRHPVYSQGVDSDFVSHLSVVDAISHLGFDTLASFYRND